MTDTNGYINGVVLRSMDLIDDQKELTSIERMYLKCLLVLSDKERDTLGELVNELLANAIVSARLETPDA